MVESFLETFLSKKTTRTVQKRSLYSDSGENSSYFESPAKRTRISEELNHSHTVDDTKSSSSSTSGQILSKIKSFMNRLTSFMEEPPQTTVRYSSNQASKEDSAPNIAERENILHSVLNGKSYESGLSRSFNGTPNSTRGNNEQLHIPKRYSSAINLDKGHRTIGHRTDNSEINFKFQPSVSFSTEKPSIRKKFLLESINYSKSSDKKALQISKQSRKIFKPTFSKKSNTISSKGFSIWDCIKTPAMSFRLDEKIQYKTLLQQYTSSSVIPKCTSYKDFLSPYRPSAEVKSAENSCAIVKKTLDESWSNLNTSRLFSQEKEQPEKEKHHKSIISSSSTLEVIDLEPEDNKNSDDDIIVTKTIVKSPKQRRNALEDKLLSSPIYTGDCLLERKSIFEWNKEKRIKDENDILNRLNELEKNREESLKKIEERIANRLSTLDISYTAPKPVVSEKPEFPELTSDIMGAISKALRGGPLQEVLADKFNLQITRRDIHTLTGLNWLNDEVINFYMNLIVERNERNDLSKVYSFNTFFYPKLLNNGYNSVRRWTKKVDIFSHDIVFAPIHLGMHWCMSAIFFKERTIRYYDSMHSNNNVCLKTLLEYLNSEHMDKKKASYDTSNWKLENVKDIPQQMNGSDCGMFSCKFAEYLSRNSDITFNQEHMPYFRKRMIYEIVSQKLM